MRRLVGLAIVGLATLAPNWALGDDQTIAQDILQKLQTEKQEGHLKGFGIDLQVEDGTVILKGNVASKEQQQLVLGIAEKVDGVEAVVNELEIKPTAKKPTVVKAVETRESSPATKPVETRAPTPATKPVETRAPTPAAKPGLFNSMASGLAKSMSSKSSLSNPSKAKPSPSHKPEAKLVAHTSQEPSPVNPVNLEKDKPRGECVARTNPEPTQTTATRSANEIVQQIAGRLQKEKQAGSLRGFNVDLQCDNGTLWVSGHVTSQEQHALVIDIARRTAGVKQVVNDLKIGAPNATLAGHTAESIPVAEGTGVARPNATRIAPVEALGAQPIQLPGNLKLVPIQPIGQPGQFGQPVQPSRGQTPLAFAPSHANHLTATAQPGPVAMNAGAQPMPAQMPGPNVGIAPARYDHPNLPGYSWPSYASHPNYAAVSYPKQYSASAWPYIGPFYPYPQVPLGWRKVTLQWDDGWWFLDFKDK